MPSAREVYAAFESHQERQKKILASVKAEQAVVLGEFEATSKSVEASIVSLFPTVEELPLALMTETSKLKQSGSRDYTHMVDALRKQDASNREERTTLVQQNGTLETLGKSLEALQGQQAALTRKLEQENGHLLRLTEQLDQQNFKGRPVERAFEEYGIKITERNFDQYDTFKLGNWLTSQSWRRGHRAVTQYKERGGVSLEADRLSKEQLQKDLGSLATVIRTDRGQYDQLDTQIKGLQTTTGRMEALDRSYLGDAQIHKAVIAEMVEILQEEASARHLGKMLPNDKAQPLMAEALKFKNLQILHDNLETLRTGAEKALGQVSKPISKLRDLKYHDPSHRVNIDLEDISKKLGGFNDATEDYIKRSGQVRKALGDLKKVPDFSSSSSLSTTDDSYSFMNLMLMNMIVSSDGSATQSVPHHAVPQVPDVSHSHHGHGASIPNLDLHDATHGALHVPDLHALHVPTIDVSHISIPSIDVSHTISAIDHAVSSISHHSYGGFDVGSHSIGSFDGGGGHCHYREGVGPFRADRIAHNTSFNGSLSY